MVKNAKGQKSVNFGKTAKVKLTTAPSASESQDANTHLILNKQGKENVDDMALATLVELPYRAMTVDNIRSLIKDDVISVGINSTILYLIY